MRSRRPPRYRAGGARPARCPAPRLLPPGTAAVRGCELNVRHSPPRLSWSPEQRDPPTPAGSSRRRFYLRRPCPRCRSLRCYREPTVPTRYSSLKAIQGPTSFRRVEERERPVKTYPEQAIAEFIGTFALV